MTYSIYIISLLIFVISYLLYIIIQLLKKSKNEKAFADNKIQELNTTLHLDKEEFENQKNEISKERLKIKEKNKKLWKLSETVYKEKKQVDEDNKKLTINQEKYKKKIKKLWDQSIVVHKEKERIDKMKKEIEAVYKEVSDSINYAQRIQSSILPERKILKKYFSDNFVLFKPRDNVSGDFYWWTHIDNHTIITAADCTGHGVPGAFMSMLGVSFLREIVQKEYITHTGVILRKMRREIIKALKQKGEMGEQKDGMDMAIISVNHNLNTLQYSGAQNPLYIITKDARALKGYQCLDGYKGFYEIKADKMPIAIYERMDKFKSHEIQIEKGDQLYIFSDGYVDQFGGPKEKKFKSKPFKRLIYEIKDLSMAKQKELLNKAYDDWKGDVEQVDDVVVIGIQF